MKKKLIVLLMIMGLFPLRAGASGIPVVDVASNIQQITHYIQVLADYAEQLEQLATQTQQYVQMVQDYQQVMDEYTHYLNQLEGIKDKFSAAEWAQIMAQTFNTYGNSPLSVIPTMDTASATYDDDVDVVMGQYGAVPQEEADVGAEALANGFTDVTRIVEQARRDRLAYETYKSIHREVSDNEKAAVLRRAALLEIGNAIDNLGDESDLATLQLLVNQTHIMLDQNEAGLMTSNQILQQQGYERWEELSRKAERAKKEQARLVKNRTTPMPSAGKDRW